MKGYFLLEPLYTFFNYKIFSKEISLKNSKTLEKS